MKIAYLVNQYPAVSHTFIRREILALEKIGIPIKRITIRRRKDIVDPEDIIESKKTFCILETRIIKILLYSIFVFLTRPGKYIRVFSKAILIGRKNERGVFRHMIYIAEACILLIRTNQERITHIHSHFGTNSTTIVYFCKLLGGPQYSFTCHGPDEFDCPYGIALRAKIENASFVIAITNYAKCQLMRWCDPSVWNRLHVVHCTVDDSFFSLEVTKSPETPRIVCVGRLAEQKGQLLLLDAMKILSNDGIDFELVFAGDGEMKDIILKKINSLGLKEKITVTGWLNGDEIKREIISSRALVLPSFAEGLPVVIMEAFALYRPVLSTYVAGIPELVDSTCGYLVPAGDVDKIAEAVRSILFEDNNILLEKGKNGFAKVKLEHNSLIEAEKLSELFFSNNLLTEF